MFMNLAIFFNVLIFLLLVSSLNNNNMGVNIPYGYYFFKKYIQINSEIKFVPYIIFVTIST